MTPEKEICEGADELDRLARERDEDSDRMENAAACIERLNAEANVLASELDRLVARVAELERGKGHPWADFLKARANVIDYLYYRKYEDNIGFHNDAGIAHILSMDPTQVYLIRTRDERPGDNKGQIIDAALNRPEVTV